MGGIVNKPAIVVAAAAAAALLMNCGIAYAADLPVAPAYQAP
jgi:hypothetical protein